MNLGEERRLERMQADYLDSDILSDRVYNLTIGGVVLYGLLLNTVICYWLGDSLKYISETVSWVILIGYFILCFAGIWLSASSQNPTVSFIGYNMVVVPVGVVLDIVLIGYGWESVSIIYEAFLYTVIVTACMVVLGVCWQGFFAGLGGILFGSLLGLIIARLVGFLLGFDTILMAWLAVAVFSLYIGYDFVRSQEFPHTLDNAIDSALDIYLDIVNLFLNILRILGSRSSKRR